MPVLSMKPRDVRGALRGKVDPSLGRVLVGLAEDAAHLRHDLNTLGNLMEATIRALEMCMGVSMAMQRVVEDAGLSPSTLRAKLLDAQRSNSVVMSEKIEAGEAGE